MYAQGLKPCVLNGQTYGCTRISQFLDSYDTTRTVSSLAHQKHDLLSRITFLKELGRTHFKGWSECPDRSSAKGKTMKEKMFFLLGVQRKNKTNQNHTNIKAAVLKEHVFVNVLK